MSHTEFSEYLMSTMNGEWYVRFACAARRRAQCECTFEVCEIVADKFDVTRSVRIDPYMFQMILLAVANLE